MLRKARAATAPSRPPDRLTCSFIDLRCVLTGKWISKSVTRGWMRIGKGSICEWVYVPRSILRRPPVARLITALNDRFVNWRSSGGRTASWWRGLDSQQVALPPRRATVPGEPPNSGGVSTPPEPSTLPGPTGIRGWGVEGRLAKGSSFPPEPAGPPPPSGGPVSPGPPAE